MSMDPTKWVPYEKLSQQTQERIQQHYPYLKFANHVFQDKDSGVFMKALNNVKIEKLLNPDSQPRPKAAAAGGKGRK